MKTKKKNKISKYYSASLLYIVLVDDRAQKRHTHDESVFILKARNAKHAFARALQIGRSNEVTYTNVYGNRVRWALVEVLEIRRLGSRLDGVEVSSRLHEKTSRKRIAFNTRFVPQRKKPELLR